MDVLERFSIYDFLGYFFPGVIGALGILLLLFLTPLSQVLSSVTIDLTTGIFLLILCYIMGIIFSGFSVPIVRLVIKIRHLGESRYSIPLPEFNQEIIEALRSFLQIDNAVELHWSSSHFYLCRSLVQELMPTASQAIGRQVSMRQFRVNMVAPVLLWSITGVAWGIWTVINSSVTWGLVLVAVSTVLPCYILFMLINRALRSQERVVREVCAAFLVGYRAGLFEKPKENSKTRSEEALS